MKRKSHLVAAALAAIRLVGVVMARVKVSPAIVLAMSLWGPLHPAVAQTCSPVGYWTSTAKYCTLPNDQDPLCGLLVGVFIAINPDMTATYSANLTAPNGGGCQQNFTVSGSAPLFHFTPDGLASCGGSWGEFDMSLAPTCDAMTGGPEVHDWTRNRITMERLTTASASISAVPLQGSLPSGPAPGAFSFSTTVLSGPNPPKASPASGMTETSNPTTLNFVAAGPMRSPTAGGMAKLIANYTLDYPYTQTITKNDSNNIAAFGLSCYMIALESDYGSPPNNCSSTRINGVRYSGAVTNPNGLSGTYCSAFIANVKLQGSGQLNSGTYINYSPITNAISAISAVTGADGTPVVAGQTVARDRAIIPGRGVLVDIDGFGTGLLANDTGGAIIGYRLDVFRGSGAAACSNFSNPIVIGACSPEQIGTCPGRTLK